MSHQISARAWTELLATATVVALMGLGCSASSESLDWRTALARPTAAGAEPSVLGEPDAAGAEPLRAGPSRADPARADPALSAAETPVARRRHPQLSTLDWGAAPLEFRASEALPSTLTAVPIWAASAPAAVASDASAKPGSAPGVGSADPDDPLPRVYGRGPLPNFWATVRRDLVAAPGELWADTKNVVLNPIPMLILVGAGGGAAATYNTVDDDIRDFYAKGEAQDRFPHAPGRGVRDAADVLGSPQYHIAVAAACYVISIPAQDEKFYDFSKSLISALALTNAGTLGLKLAVNEDRPNGKNLGFPSGHTASSFAFASVVHDYYGPLWAAPFYGVGVFTGWGRMWDREHRFTDVWYGAVLGLVIGHSVGLRHMNRFNETLVVPMVEPASASSGGRDGNTVGLMLVRRF